MRPAKILEKKSEKSLTDTIKLFDFENDSEIKTSFLDNEDTSKPLD